MSQANGPIDSRRSLDHERAAPAPNKCRTVLRHGFRASNQIARVLGGNGLRGVVGVALAFPPLAFLGLLKGGTNLWFTLPKGGLV